MDWLVAAWAVVASHGIVESWFIGPEEWEPLASIHSSHTETLNASQSAQHGKLRFMHFLFFGMFLSALAVPSFLVDDLPRSVVFLNATPLALACILPPNFRYKHHTPKFQDFLEESKRFRSSADIMLWPEGAVTFQDEIERDGTQSIQDPTFFSSRVPPAAFETLRNALPGTYVGVSYIETYKDPQDPSGGKIARRNAFSLISNSSLAPHLTYSKRYLVPSKP
jgi:hypothetical protein